MDDNSRKRPLSVQWLCENSERVGQRPRVGSFGTGNATHSFSGQGIQHTGRGDFNVRGDINMTKNYAAPTTATGDCLRELFITDPSEDRAALKRKKGNRAAGTCEWILGTKELTAWLGQGQTSNVLWLHGNPGIGKSTMAIFLTEELATTFSETDGKTLAYFFCDSGFDKQKTATSILRGLLFQLVEQHQQLLSHILPIYEKRGAGLFKSFDALWKVFITAAADQDLGQTYCIIDALDECDQESQSILLHQLQETFHIQKNLSNIRILITSRPYPEIREYLKIFINEDLTSFLMIKEDIDRYIIEKVKCLAKKKNYTDSIQQQVSNMLKDKAENTFLWIGLACEQLEKLFAKDAIRALQHMPKGLYSLYGKLLNKAQEGLEPGIIQRILGLVAICVRPLTVLELSESCQLYEEEDIETRVQFTRDQIASCRLMIIVQDEKVLLLHQSVKDYLFGLSSSFFVNELESHANLAYHCVKLLIEQFHGKRSHTHFLSYAMENWANHARLAQSSFKVRDSEVEFFSADSSSREQWLENLRLDNYYPTIPEKFSILHVAGRWGVVTLVDYIANPNFQQPGIKTISSPIDFDSIDFYGRTPIDEAMNSRHLNVVSRLLDLNVKMSEYVMEVAARIGKETMALFLSRRGNEIPITEKVVKAAAENHDKEVIALLLKHRGHQITITEEVVKAAAKNRNKEVMSLLLECRSNEVIITEEVIESAAEYGHQEVIALLLEYQGHQVTITEEVVKAAARRYYDSKEVIALLLRYRGHQVTITGEVISAAARRGNKEVMALLLEYQEHQVPITEEVVEVVAKYHDRANAKEAMAFLLNHQKVHIVITEKVISTIAANCNGEIMALLLEKYGDEITITEEIVEAAARNSHNGSGVMLVLLSQRGNEFPSASRVLYFFAANFDAKVMALFLSQRGDSIIITEEVIQAAAKNQDHSEAVTALLLDQRGIEVTITEEVLQAAANNFCTGKEVMGLLLDHGGSGIPITENVLSAAAAVLDKKRMELLLNQRGNEIAITESVLIAAATNLDFSKEVLSLLLNQRQHPITITEKVVITAAENERPDGEVLSLLLDQQQYPITITESVLIAAAGNWGAGRELLLLLLNQQQHPITITEEVVVAAAGNWRGREVLSLLLNQRQHPITITEKVVIAAAGNNYSGVGVMSLLLSLRGNKITITEGVLKTAKKWHMDTEVITLLNQQDHHITNTEAAIKTEAEHSRCAEEIITLLLNQQGHQVTITEEVVEVVKAATGNHVCAQKLIEFLLNQRGYQVTITEEVVKAAAANEHRAEDIMILLFNQRGDQVTITEDVIKAAATGGRDDVLDLLSKDRSIVTNWDKWRCISKFYNAAETGDVHCIRQLLNKGVEPDTKNFRGETPLLVAARNGHEAVVELLVREEGVNVNSLSIDLRSPLFGSSEEGHEGIVVILMEAGADPYLVDKYGHTAITRAKEFGNARIVRMLERVW